MADKRFLHRPIYRQVCDVLSERIASGEWKAGQALPNEIELARDMGVSGGTVRKALELMEASHMLTRRQGRGTFVADPESGRLADRFCNLRTTDGRIITGSLQVLEITQAPADDAERARLRLGPHDLVWRLRRLRRDAGRVFMHERVTLPVSLFARMQDNAPQRIVALAHSRGLMLGPAEERVSLAAASPEAAVAMALTAGAPILLLDRVVRTTEAQPVEWRLAECHLGDAHYQTRLK